MTFEHLCTWAEVNVVANADNFGMKEVGTRVGQEPQFGVSNPWFRFLYYGPEPASHWWDCHKIWTVELVFC